MSRTGLPTTASPMRAAWSIGKRELVSFLRQKARVFSALMTPVLFWFFLGLGMGSSFRPDGGSREGYEVYFFPGVVILAVVLAGIFSTISTIQDRQSGFLQSVLVAPIPRWSIVLGKMLGATSIAMVQGILILPLGLVAGVHLSPATFLLSLLMLLLVSLMMTGMGFYFAWRIDSVQGFHGIMNLILMPMWILSGSFFPSENAITPIRWIMAVNPLTYGLAGLRRLFHLDREFPGLPSLGLSLLVMASFGFFSIVLASKEVARRRS